MAGSKVVVASNDSHASQYEHCEFRAHRYPHPVAADWPDLLAIGRARVRPGRNGLRRKPYKERWWLHAEPRPALYSAVWGLDRVVTVHAVGQHAACASLPSSYVFSNALIVVPLHSYASL